MIGPEQTDPQANADAAHLEAEMDADLAALAAKAPGDGRHVRNPVFVHEQTVGTAVVADEATETAARVSGELAAEADQERLLIGRQVAGLEQAAARGDQAKDAEEALARAEQDADQAISSSLDSDEAAEDARHAVGSRLFHRGADGAEAELDESRALHDESVAAGDVRELDALELRVAADAAAVSPASA
jgi:hypothetical protein